MLLMNNKRLTNKTHSEIPEDLQRLQDVYAQREQQLAGNGRYTALNPVHLFTTHQRQRAVANLLRRERITSLQDKHILEMGCGKGDILQELLAFGAAPSRLFGTDLILNRAQTAVQQLPHLPLSAADGRSLPYPAAAFDLVLQYTVFSSILDENIWHQLAQEMLRVLKPGGLIIWYDFWLNPTNKQTRGIRPPAIRNLFPDCTFTFQRITLAPPLARRLIPLSWLTATLLEKLRFLNTHYLVAIRPI